LVTLQEKLNEWKRQLLDLSKRNRLLHFKETKRQTLCVEQPRTEEVFKRIVGVEKPLTVVGVDPKSLVNLIDDATDSDPTSASQPIKVNEIRFVGSPQTVATALYTLRARSKIELEERGVGVLFLAFGFLHWFESDDSDYEIVSPIVLAPVDLDRETMLEPYRVVPRDDEVVANPTLQKILVDQFKIKLPDLPGEEDWSLVDYLEQVRLMIASKSRWRVEDVTYLSIFSFMKLNMYRDLENGLSNAEESPLLQALAGDRSLLVSTMGDTCEIPARELDARVELSQCLQVLDADSSQQQAIELAKAGGSFVLQGPPGTGKSQTIVNIIAELLGLGKTVLFVSEKVAALDVVHRRLTEVGLSDSCLALHSHKADKREVIQELGRVYSLGNGVGPIAPFNYHRLCERKDALNTYVRELHATREPMGKSIFQVESMAEALIEVPLVPFEIGAIDELTLDSLELMRDAIARLAGSAAAIDTIEGNPWRGSIINGRSQEVLRVTLQRLKTASSSCKEVEQRTRALAGSLGLDASIQGTSRAEWMVGIAHALAGGPDFYGPWLTHDRLARLINSEGEAFVQHRAAQDEAVEVGEVFTEDLATYDLEALAKRIATEYHSFFSRLGAKYRSEIRYLATLTKSGEKPRFGDLERLVPIAQKLRDHRLWVESSTQRLVEEFGSWYSGDDTDWAALEAALAWTAQLLTLFAGPVPESFADHVANVLAERSALLSEADALHVTLAELAESLDEIESWFEKSAPTRITLKSRADALLPSLDEQCKELVDGIEGLSAWTRLASAVESCAAAGITNPVEVLRPASLRADAYVPALEKRVFTLWLDHWFGVVPVLCDFEATSHTHLIEDFRRLDADLKIAARRVLVSKLAERRPHPSTASMNLSSSQPALLMKEARKKRRYKPLRVLFAEIPELLVTIKPCLMMSPLSVGQFLPLGTLHFDAVVFDEASQVKPEDAVGAIMRGSQLIVVGDRKQLPPTSFFDVSMGDDLDEDEYYNDANAYESILDLCGTVGLPEKMLKWHYRSRREGLIAFSNSFLYDNRLVTFPSPDFDGAGTGVEFRYVEDGVYDRSRTRTNAREVQEILEIVRSHARHHADKSLGVVTFSQAQMTAIDTAILRMREDDTTLEGFFGNMYDEPFFVKNLENVQGDERDVIVFSVGYGRDAMGKLAMNFGPLNNNGGERRLNVAVTRAREKVVLVSSIRGADLELSKTNAEGVRLLKHYLDYAERGIKALDAMCMNDENAEYGSPFEEQVAGVLRTAGYRVDMQVGCSGYRIDLAIVHPERPGQYALGIECDGASYHSAATARERDRLREQVLVKLGWKLYRIWSTDWFKARSKQVEKLLAAVEAAINVPEFSTETQWQEEVAVQTSTESDNDQVFPTQLEVPVRDYLAEVMRPYIESRPKRQYSDFYGNMAAVKNVLLEVVEMEAPLHIDVAVRRVASAWRITRAGSRVQDVCRRALELSIRDKAVVIRGKFIYSSVEKSIPVRRNVPGGSTRLAEEIAPEEIAAVVEIVLRDQIKLSHKDLLVASARALGFERTGSDVRAAVQTGVDLLLENGRVIQEFGFISIV
jgi:very-short-patch-repair endonuclease